MVLLAHAAGRYPIAFVQQSRVLQHLGDLADFLQLNRTLLRSHLEAALGEHKVRAALRLEPPCTMPLLPSVCQ